MTATPASYSWPLAILFYRCSLDLFFFFSPSNLQVRLADRHQTLPHVRWWPRFIIFGQKYGCPLPRKKWQPKNIKILARFRTTWRLVGECLRNATRHRQSKNGVANYRHSRTSQLNSVYFGPQTAKNRTGVLIHPTGGHHAVHCHESSVLRCRRRIAFESPENWRFRLCHWFWRLVSKEPPRISA